MLQGASSLYFRSCWKIQVGRIDVIEKVGEGFLGDDHGQLGYMGIGKTCQSKYLHISIADMSFGLQHLKRKVDQGCLFCILGITFAKFHDIFTGQSLTR